MMNPTLQAIEEGILKDRFPITYALMKQPNYTVKSMPNWLRWYSRKASGDSGYEVMAQTGWEANYHADVVVATATEPLIAENIVNSHNLILENVQRADFARASA